jgi:hypothetical protein
MVISLNLNLNYFSFSQAIEEGFNISLYVFSILIKAVHSVSIILDPIKAYFDLDNNSSNIYT